MPPSPYRLVIDTNVLIRGLANSESASGQILDICQERLVVMILSKPLLSEYRAVSRHPEVIKRLPGLKRRKVELVLRALRYVADVISTTGFRFLFPRDASDAKLIELALAADATHIISLDHDLLALRKGHDESAKRIRQRLPKIEIMTPEEFLRTTGKQLQLERDSTVSGEGET